MRFQPVDINLEMRQLVIVLHLIDFRLCWLKVQAQNELSNAALSEATDLTKIQMAIQNKLGEMGC